MKIKKSKHGIASGDPGRGMPLSSQDTVANLNLKSKKGTASGDPGRGMPLSSQDKIANLNLKPKRGGASGDPGKGMPLSSQDNIASSKLMKGEASGTSVQIPRPERRIPIQNKSAKIVGLPPRI